MTGRLTEEDILAWQPDPNERTKQQTPPRNPGDIVATKMEHIRNVSKIVGNANDTDRAVKQGRAKRLRIRKVLITNGKYGKRVRIPL